MVESGRRRRFFPDAFKPEAVAAVRAGRPVPQVAAELGLPERLVRARLRWAEGRATAGGGGAPAPTGHPTGATSRRQWRRWPPAAPLREAFPRSRLFHPATYSRSARAAASIMEGAAALQD